MRVVVDAGIFSASLSRRRRSRRELAIESLDVRVVPLPAAVLSPDAGLYAEDLTRQVAASIGEIVESRRAVVRMYLAGYARLLPNARTDTIAAAGHAPHAERPDAAVTGPMPLPAIVTISPGATGPPINEAAFITLALGSWVNGAATPAPRAGVSLRTRLLSKSAT